MVATTGIVIITATTGGSVKVAELKEGMLLRFKEPRIYKFLRDSGVGFWMDCGSWDPRFPRLGTPGRPLMVYLGQERMKHPSIYGGYYNVRKVSIEGRVAMVFPDTWRHVEEV